MLDGIELPLYQNHTEWTSPTISLEQSSFSELSEVQSLQNHMGCSPHFTPNKVTHNSHIVYIVLVNNT